MQADPGSDHRRPRRRKLTWLVGAAAVVLIGVFAAGWGTARLLDDDASDAVTAATTPPEPASPAASSIVPPDATPPAPSTTQPPDPAPPSTAPREPAGAPTASAPALPEDAAFVATFDTPEDFFERFQTEVLFGTGETDVPQWHGDHDETCAGPETQRTVHGDRTDQMFWWCAPKGPESGHVMTSMYTTGYAQVDFSPDQTFDRVTEVCWDQNQTEVGGRKWTQVVVVPEATYLANDRKLSYVKPGLQEDVAVAGIELSDEVFLFEMLRGSTTTYVGQTVEAQDFAGFTTDDKARRFRTCIRDLEDGTVQIELERESTTETRVLAGALPDGPARVIFQDDNYDPPKGSLGNRPDLATWHWDNIAIS